MRKMISAERVLNKVVGVSKCKGFPTPPIIISHISPQSLSSFSRLSFSSHSNSPPPPPTTTNGITPLPSPDDDLPADVPTQELKRRIDSYLGGDTEAIPSIFEAILARKLRGNHGDTDDELIEELRSNVTSSDEDSSGSEETDDDVSD